MVRRVGEIVGADRKGAIFHGRGELNFAKQWFAENTNPDRKEGTLSDVLRGMIEDGQKVLATEYNDAVERIELYNAALDQAFLEGVTSTMSARSVRQRNQPLRINR